MRNMKRAFSLLGLSLSNSTPSKDTPSPPTWQCWQRTLSAKEKFRMTVMSSARVKSTG